MTPRRWPVVLALAVPLLAQKPAELFSKAPPDVDEALRARVRQFYQAHVDGKPRRAEEVVAEESKDLFYNSKKAQYLSFEISRIDYSQDFKKATVTSIVETQLPVLGFTDKPVKIPLASLWKIENGQWCWYIDPESINMTPFGKVGTPPGVTASGSSQPLPDLSKGPDVKTLQQKVGLDKTVVVFQAGEASSDQVTFTNSMSGSVGLSLPNPPIPGLAVSLSATQLGAGQKATITIRYTPGPDAPTKPVVVWLEAHPFGRYIPINVEFK